MCCNGADYYGHLYDLHLFDPLVSNGNKAPIAYAVGQYTGKDGNTFGYTRLNNEFGQLVVLRLTPHGQTQPQNSPHGWERKTATHTCFDPGALPPPPSAASYVPRPSCARCCARCAR
tara:strand:+ start:522 stop:872 length:351 start_codon:yes stop_codon:yes gene_type:complete